MSDSTMVFDDLDVVGFSASTIPTGRINQTRPRIAIIGDSSAAAQAAVIAAKYYGNKFDFVDVDYAPLEERVIAHMTQEDLLMQEMEKAYKYQVQSAEQLDKFMRDPYGIREVRERGQGRKNGHRSSYVAKDHRSATKRQRAARKKNRKK